MRKATILAALLLAGCGHTNLDVGVGHVLSTTTGEPPWQGGNTVLDLRVRNQHGRGWIEFQHVSSIKSGPPFNKDYESTMDKVTVGITFGLFRGRQ